MNALIPIPSPFDTTLDQSREAYLASPVWKARKAILKAQKLTRALAFSMDGVAHSLTLGNGTERAIRALDDAMRELRIETGQVGELARLAEAP